MHRLLDEMVAGQARIEIPATHHELHFTLGVFPRPLVPPTVHPGIEGSVMCRNIPNSALMDFLKGRPFTEAVAPAKSGHEGQILFLRLRHGFQHGAHSWSI